MRTIGLTGQAHRRRARERGLRQVASLPSPPLAAGRPKAEIIVAVNGERAAFAHVWATTATAAGDLKAESARDIDESIGHLTNGRRVALFVDGAAAFVAIGATLALGQRARRRERAERAATQRQNFETTLQRALEMARAEPDVYEILTEALRESIPTLQVEMLVADSSRAHFHQTFATATAWRAEPRTGCGVVSPLDCPATRRGHTLVFPTSTRPRRLSAPARDARRATAPRSASRSASPARPSACCTRPGPTQCAASETEVRYLEITSRRASERIAMLRAFEKSEAQASSDPLTGLWNRRSLENRVHELHRDGTPYALAYGDLDHFKMLNDTHGHEAGDQALRLFARVLRDSVRPDDSSRATAARSSSSSCPTATRRPRPRCSNACASDSRSRSRPDAFPRSP